MLSQLFTTSVVLPKMDSMISIAHMTPSWPQSSPQNEFWYFGLPGTIPPPWMYCVPQLDSIICADELIPNSDL